MNKVKLLCSIVLLALGLNGFAQEFDFDHYVNRYFSIQYPMTWDKQEVAFDNVCSQISFFEPQVLDGEDFRSSTIVVKWYRKTSKTTSDLVEDFNAYYRAKYEDPTAMNIEREKMLLRFGGYDGLTTSFFIEKNGLLYNHQIYALKNQENRGFIITVSLNAKDKESLDRKRRMIEKVIADFHVYGGFVEQDMQTVAE